MATQAFIKEHQYIRGKNRDTNAKRPITSVRVVIGLTNAQASRLPSHGRVKPLLGQGATTVSSRVWRGGGEVELVYHLSSRPFDGAKAEDIPKRALAHVREKLSATPR